MSNIQSVAKYLQLDTQYLIDLMSEDDTGGRDTGQWIGMSVHAVEGQLLYALVRHFKPKHVLEIGMAQGCGTTHILRALAKNGTGKMTSVDIDFEAGSGIPDELRHLHTFILGDSRYVKLPKADFVFEDADHLYEPTLATLTRVLELKPRVLVSHDLLSHQTYGDEFGVMRAWNTLFGDDFIVYDRAFTGIGVKVF